MRYRRGILFFLLSLALIFLCGPVHSWTLDSNGIVSEDSFPVQEYTVKGGDRLWNLFRTLGVDPSYGETSWDKLHAAASWNNQQIKNAELKLLKGQVLHFRIPFTHLQRKIKKGRESNVGSMVELAIAATHRSLDSFESEVEFDLPDTRTIIDDLVYQSTAYYLNNEFVLASVWGDKFQSITEVRFDQEQVCKMVSYTLEDSYIFRVLYDEAYNNVYTQLLKVGSENERVEYHHDQGQYEIINIRPVYIFEGERKRRTGTGTVSSYTDTQLKAIGDIKDICKIVEALLAMESKVEPYEYNPFSLSNRRWNGEYGYVFEESDWDFDLSVGLFSQEYHGSDVGSDAGAEDLTKWIYFRLARDFHENEYGVHSLGSVINANWWDGQWVDPNNPLSNPFFFKGQAFEPKFEYRLKRSSMREYFLNVGHLFQKEKGWRYDDWGKYETRSRYLGYSLTAGFDDFSRHEERWFSEQKGAITWTKHYEADRDSRYISKYGDTTLLDEKVREIDALSAKYDVVVFNDPDGLYSIGGNFWVKFTEDDDITFKASLAIGFFDNSLKIGPHFTFRDNDGVYSYGLPYSKWWPGLFEIRVPDLINYIDDSFFNPQTKMYREYKAEKLREKMENGFVVPSGKDGELLYDDLFGFKKKEKTRVIVKKGEEVTYEALFGSSNKQGVTTQTSEVTDEDENKKGLEEEGSFLKTLAKLFTGGADTYPINNLSESEYALDGDGFFIQPSN